MNLKELRQKIKSVKSTAKLTQAMQMVAASKMNKAIAWAIASRDYSIKAWEVINNLVGKTQLVHSLLQQSGITSYQSPVIVVFTSNRGLAGSFNSNVIKLTLENLNQQTKIITVGKKAKEYFARFHPDKLLASFDLPATYADTTLAQELFSFLRNQFSENKIDQVLVAYNKFLSVIKQAPTKEIILPISPDNNQATTHYNREVTIEPDEKSVLDLLIPRIIIAKILQITLESIASEQAARMVAMKNATENAREIASDLTLTYQSLRQASITREIIEVSAGATALNNS